MEVRLDRETIWLTQEQMSELFSRERSVITKHLRNVFKEGELEENSVRAKYAHNAVDGKKYQTQFYNLDAIISVGYRVNSKQGTRFRQWATQILRDHIVKGYTVNEQRLREESAKLREMQQTMELLARTLAAQELVTDMHNYFVSRVDDITRRIAKGNIEACQEIIFFLGNWLNHHVIEEDKRITACN